MFVMASTYNKSRAINIRTDHILLTDELNSFNLGSICGYVINPIILTHALISHRENHSINEPFSRLCVPYPP